MVAYDPDERITAHQALRHPYFQEQRAAEKQALAGHRRAFFPERPVASELLSNLWHVAEEDSQQVLSEGGELRTAVVAGPGCPRVARVSVEDVPPAPAWKGARLRGLTPCLPVPSD